MIQPRFVAPWGRPLRWISALVVLLMMAATVVLFVEGGGRFRWLAVLPWLGLAVAALFGVRGYDVADGTLTILRPGWCTRISLAGLESVAAVPNAMKGSLRTFGNGGLFSFTGWYWSRSLGSHRAWVNDLERTVVLKVRGRTLVLSPDAPESFIRAVHAAVGAAAC